MTLPFEPGAVAGRLLAWYGRAGRDLPWRQTRDPYRIWLSEIMLQQTTVAAVIPYYEKFLGALPTIVDLAEASRDDVLALWAGLGYYSRARNLHEAARRVVRESAGVFPETLDDLLALPGVGRSTAGAILSIAYDRPAPILDGNVRRVLVRLFAWREDPRSSRAEKQLWEWAEALTSRERPHDYAQAIMDLGATVCTPRDPACAACPLTGLCRAEARGLVPELPVRRKQQPVPVRRQIALLVRSKAGLLVRQRPADGLLGGMWELPSSDLPEERTAVQAARALRDGLGFTGRLYELGSLRHAYSHFRLELALFSLQTGSGGESISQDGRWCSGPELETLPLHGAHRKAYEQFGAAA